MYFNDSDNDSEEDDITTDENFKPAFVVIAIDTHPRMFVKKENDTIPFRNCLEACLALAESLIFTQNRKSWSQFAVLLAREEPATFISFQDNVIDIIKRLKEKVKLVNKELADEFQRKGDFDLATFFLACKKVFHDLKSPFHKRTLIYITDDDDPVHDANKKFTALNEVKTFPGSQITFQVLPSRVDFNYKNFFNELFSLMDHAHVEEICEDKEGLIEKLTSTIVRRNTQRKLHLYPFKNDFSYYFNSFITDVIHESKLLNVKLRNDGKAVKKIQESNPFVNFSIKNDIPEINQVAADLFDQQNIFDQNLPMGLTLLYITKRITGVGYVLGKPFLLGHKQDNMLPHFVSIWQYCANKERVLICARKLKHPDKIRYVQLVPITVNGASMFLGKRIPFSSEIFYPKVSNYPKQNFSVEKRNAVENLVNALTFDFDVKMIPDASYRKREAYVKSKLLDEPMEEVSGVVFDASALDKHLQKSVSMINSTFTLVEEKKRKAPASRAPRKKKT